jgi:hypothetical protein
MGIDAIARDFALPRTELRRILPTRPGRKRKPEVEKKEYINPSNGVAEDPYCMNRFTGKKRRKWRFFAHKTIY